eukprot:13229291-Ditylum_brightwellii.AAC.1
MTRRNASKNTPYANTERNTATTWKTSTVTPRVDKQGKPQIVMDTESEVMLNFEKESAAEKMMSNGVKA